MNTHFKKFIFLLFSLCILAAFEASKTTKLFVPYASFHITDDKGVPEIFLHSDADLLL